MNKVLILIISSLIFLVSCKQTNISNTHGISYLEKREKLILVKESNKNDTIKVLGYPATTGMENDNLWIYIERTNTKGSLFKLGKNQLAKNNVLVLEFNKFGILDKKEFYNKEDMNKVDFAKAITVNNVKKENFIYGFLSSVRSKMENKRK